MGNPKVIYKPTVKYDHAADVVKITYFNREKGHNVSFKVDAHSYNTASKAIQELPKQIANLASGKKPNIDPDELLESYENNIKPGSTYWKGGYIADVRAVYEFCKDLVGKFSKPNSEGGRMITPNEQYDMMKKWHQWFGDKY